MIRLFIVALFVILPGGGLALGGMMAYRCARRALHARRGQQQLTPAVAGGKPQGAG